MKKKTLQAKRVDDEESKKQRLIRRLHQNVEKNKGKEAEFLISK